LSLQKALTSENAGKHRCKGAKSEKWTENKFPHFLKEYNIFTALAISIKNIVQTIQH